MAILSSSEIDWPYTVHIIHKYFAIISIKMIHSTDRPYSVGYSLFSDYDNFFIIYNLLYSPILL